MDKKRTSSLIADEENDMGLISIPIILSGGANPFEVKGEEIPEAMPLLPLRNNVLFPGAVLPVTVSRDRSARVIRP